METNRTLDHCKAPSEPTYRVLSWLMVAQFTLALPLNLTVLYVFIFRFKFWKNNCVFLFNIVVADFLLVVCLPVKVYHYQHQVRRSDNQVLCKAMLFMLFLNRGASIAFLIVLSLDRYFNVVHLGRRNIVRALKTSPRVSVFIWLLLLPLTVPTLVNSFECCNSLGRQMDSPSHDVTDTFREVVFFAQIVFPFFVLVYCTVRIVSRLRRRTVGAKTRLRRAVFAVVSVLLVFSICFLPCTGARVVLLSVRLLKLQAAEEVVVQVYDALMVLSYSDCLLDPLVYCFCNLGFKNAYTSVFCPAFLQRRLTGPDWAESRTNTTTMRGRSGSIPIMERSLCNLPIRTPRVTT